MTEQDCVTCLNHVVDVIKLVFKIESPSGWQKGIAVNADIGYLVSRRQVSHRYKRSRSSSPACIRCSELTDLVSTIYAY